jgi:hypothetical protein
MTAQHTPGPWEIKDQPEETCQIKGGPQSATVIADVWCTDFSDGAANAHLIAAAPDLLEACRRIYRLTMCPAAFLPGPIYVSVEECDLLARAIARAEGIR